MNFTRGDPVGTTNQIETQNIPVLQKFPLVPLPFTNSLQRKALFWLILLEFDFACYRTSQKGNHTISTYVCVCLNSHLAVCLGKSFIKKNNNSLRYKLYTIRFILLK